MIACVPPAAFAPISPALGKNCLPVFYLPCCPVTFFSTAASLVLSLWPRRFCLDKLLTFLCNFLMLLVLLSVWSTSPAVSSRFSFPFLQRIACAFPAAFSCPCLVAPSPVFIPAACIVLCLSPRHFSAAFPCPFFLTTSPVFPLLACAFFAMTSPVLAQAACLSSPSLRTRRVACISTLSCIACV
eukprot:g16161.t1